MTLIRLRSQSLNPILALMRGFLFVEVSYQFLVRNLRILRFAKALNTDAMKTRMYIKFKPFGWV